MDTYFLYSIVYVLLLVTREFLFVFFSMFCIVQYKCFIRMHAGKFMGLN